MRKLQQVVVLGAGPGGLAAAHQLSSYGIKPVVLEKQSYVAGLCHTIVKDGFRFDIGGHRWFTKNDELNQWFITLMKGELINVPRISRIYFDGKYFTYPIGIKNVLKNAGIFSSAHALASYVFAQVAALGSDKEPQNMEDAYVKQFGRKLYEMFFKCYSEKVWGQPCTQISADWVEQRTKGLSIVSAIQNSLLGSKRKPTSLVEEFLYPKYGYSRISERMAEDIAARGGKILLNHQVLSVLHENGEVKGVEYQDPQGKKNYLEADAIVSSIPLTLLTKNMIPRPPDEIIQAAGQLKFRDIITINVMLDRQQVTDDTWLYIHDSRIPFARLHEPKNWSPEMAPPDQTSIVAEFFCTVGDPIWNKSDSELCDITVNHLAETLRFIDKREVIGAFAFRARQAYPVYGLDYQTHLQRIKDYVATIQNLQIIGRGGTFRYNNSDHSIEMGLLAGKNLMGARYRIDSVNEAREYLEEKQFNDSVTAK